MAPSDVDGQVALARILRAIGKHDESVSHYRRAIALSPACVAAHLGLGSLLLQKDRIDDALNCFRNALAANPDNAELIVAIGPAEEQRGNVADAIGVTGARSRFGPPHRRPSFLEMPCSNRGRGGSPLLLQRRHPAAAGPWRGPSGGGLVLEKCRTRSGEVCREFFDSYADKFDSHLVQALRYSVPDHSPTRSGNSKAAARDRGTSWTSGA